MIRIGILGDIGSGKTYVANNFGYPVFSADKEVALIYKKDKKVFYKLKKLIPNFISIFPINKKQISKAILANQTNLKKIVKIVHPIIRKKMNIFLKKNINKKIIILDIPLLLENNLNKKNDILVFIQSRKIDIIKKLKNRAGFNKKLYYKFKKIQKSNKVKKKKSNFIIKNDFTKKTVKKSIKEILNKIIK